MPQAIDVLADETAEFALVLREGKGLVGGA